MLTVSRPQLPGVSFAMPMASGRYYGSPFAVSLNAVGAAIGGLYAVPLPIAKAVVLDEIGIEVSGAAAAGGAARLGIYATDEDGLPGDLLIDAGAVVTDATGFQSVTGLALPLYVGWWWAAAYFYTAAPGSVRGSGSTVALGSREPTDVTAGLVGLSSPGWGSTWVGGLPSRWPRTNASGNVYGWVASLPRILVAV